MVWVGAGLWQLPVQAASVMQAEAATGGASILPTQPSGFAERSSGFPLGSEVGDAILDGLSLGTLLATNYNSNVAPTQNEATLESKDDSIISLGANLGYLSKASDLTFGGNYQGNYNRYLSNTEFSGYTQKSGLRVNYNGGRFTISATGNMSIDRGSNINYSSGFVTQTTYSGGLLTRYQLSPKTSLQGDFSMTATSASDQNSHAASGGNPNDTQSYNLGVSALWKYSPLTEFGPGIRYSSRSGNQSSRDAVGPTASVNYKLSKKVALTSRIGMDFPTYVQDGSTDSSFSASLGLNYQASKLWGMNFSLFRDTQANTSQAGGFTEVTSLRLGYRRKMPWALWSLGVGYQMNSTMTSGDASSQTTPDQDHFTADTSLGMPLFSNTCYGSLFLLYNTQSGGNLNSWDAFQTGINISRSF